MSESGIASLLAEQCPNLNLVDTETAIVRAGPSDSKTEATVIYRPNRTEFERRRATGLSGITRLDQLDLLMGLPAGLPVMPDRTDRRTLCRLLKGCVDITAEGFVRQIVKPLDVRLAIVTGQQYKPGLIRAGRFAPFCSRLLALTGKPRNLTEKAIEADYWGIGLIVNAATGPELVVPPTPFEQHRHTPAGWAFAEDIYQQVGTQTHSSTACAIT